MCRSFVTNVKCNHYSGFVWRQKPQDHMAKKILIRGKIRSSRFVHSDCSNAFTPFPVNKMTVNFFLQKNFEGGKFKRHFHAKYADFTLKKSKGVSTVPKWESFMTTPESTSIVLNLTCQQYKRAVIQRLTLWYSLLALSIVRCQCHIETIQHSYIVRC